MKISKELSDSYLHCLASSNGNVKTVCDALEQAVAENLELKHKLYHWQKNTFAACSDCPTDELAEAGKLLRGQQYRTEIEESVKPNKDRAAKKAEELLPSGLCPYSQLHGHGRGAKVDRRICEICWTANKVAVAAELRALYDKLLRGQQ